MPLARGVDLHHGPMAQASRTSTSTEVLAGLVERVTLSLEFYNGI